MYFRIGTQYRNLRSNRTTGFVVVIILTLGMIAKVSAGVISPQVHVSTIRTHSNGNTFITIDATTTCGTNTFLVIGTDSGAKAMLSVALSAKVTGAKVRLEMDNAGCTGWGTRLNSIYLD